MEHSLHLSRSVPQIRMLASVFLAMITFRSADALALDRTDIEILAPDSGLLSSKSISVDPALGMIVFSADDGSITPRPVVGFFFNGNISKALRSDVDMTFLGIQSGFLFSYLGSVGSGLYDGSSILVPLNLIIGWNTSSRSRVCAHGGAQFIYRSSSGTMRVGDEGSPVASSSTGSVFPNIGLDFEASVGKNIGIVVRPDISITPGSDIYVLTAALTFQLG